MRLSLLLIVLYAATLSTVSCATSATSAPDAQFIALEHRWVEALRKHDVSALDALLDDSFLDSTFRGTVRTKHDVIAGPPAGGSYQSVAFEEMKVRRYDMRTAIVTGVNVLQGGKDVVRVRFTDVFVVTHGEWRAVSAQETLETK